MIDLDELAEAIRNMGRRSALHVTLKRELSHLGYWRNLPRGDPAKGYQMKGTKRG